MMKDMRTLTICLLLTMSAVLRAQQDSAAIWADSVFATMNLDRQIGQLFMIRAHSDLGADHIASVKDQIIRYHVGGLCFFQGTPKGHAALINAYQVLSDVPLMVAMDAEWGGGMRFKESGFSFPRQLMLGAVQDNRLIYEMGKTVGGHLRDIGIHVNFAPVVDINNNPANPVIGDRSFGEDKYNVTAKSYQYMLGLQDAGVLPCAKHFPGHGDTDTDSHLDLPVIKHSRARLDSIELYPFRSLIQKGLPSLMVAHLHIPALDSTPNLPTTLSKPVVTGLLRDELKFDGIIFTDALEMKGVTKHYAPGQVELLAFEAGNDMLVLPQNIQAAFDTLKAAFTSNRLKRSDLEDKVKRILRAKYRLGLRDVRDVITPMERVAHQAGDAKALGLKEQLIENAITVVSNRDKIIPVRDLDSLKVGTLMIGAWKQGRFEERVGSYVEAQHFTVERKALDERKKPLIQSLERKDLVIVGIQGLSKKADDRFGVDAELNRFLTELNGKTDVIVVVFGSPYTLKYLPDLPHCIIAYDEDPQVQDVVVQGIFGAFGMKGKLPVSGSESKPSGVGMQTPSMMRLGYSVAERVGMSSDTLVQIGKIVQEMIDKKAAPGCQILVAKDGKVIYEKAFGHFTYKKNRKVETGHLYDLASLTKVLASTLSIMRLTDEGKICPEDTLGEYFPEARGTNKGSLQLTSLLSHMAGLAAWIPFYQQTVEQKPRKVQPLEEVYSKEMDIDYCIPVAEDMYMCFAYVDSIWEKILTSELAEPGKYVYSDLAFLMFAKMIQSQTGQSLDIYADRTFYAPLGVERLLFNPLKKFGADEIAPTEEDDYFRNQKVQGYVHDMSAAMLGGVSGHAGLFGNAKSVAVVMQMLMNGGYYGGKQYLSPEVIDVFTTRVPGSTRRGLGFDMKELDPKRRNLTSHLSSPDTYGHTGFTGTCAWNDPQTGLVYIFLSNRTYPTMHDTKFREGEYRQRVHTVLYRAMR